MKMNLFALVCSLVLALLQGQAQSEEDYARNNYLLKVMKNNYLKVTVLLPDAEKGYYRGTRFDWSGIIGQVEYGGHTFFKEWEIGLPPMLDAHVIPGKTTAPWIAKYGYTLKGCKAGPWMNSVFSGNIVYVHVLDWPKEGVRLSAIPRKLISSNSITGNVQVKQDENGWLITGTPDPLNTIVKLEFDASVEEIAYALPSKGSLTLGRERMLTNDSDGRTIAEVNLDGEKTISRFEFTIDNPGYLRGQGKAFELQAKQADGTWKTSYKGSVYGTICGKQFDPVKTKVVRLIIQAKEIKQFDAF